MEKTAMAMRIKEYLGNLEGVPGARLQDVIDDEIFEVLAGVAWVREVLAHSASAQKSEGRRHASFGLGPLAF